MATYDQLLDRYAEEKLIDLRALGSNATSRDNDMFNQWVGALMAKTGAKNWNEIPAAGFSAPGVPEGFFDMIGSVLGTSTPANPTVSVAEPNYAPPAAIDRLLPSDNSPDEAGLFAQLSGFLTTLVGGLSRPNTDLTVSPVTTTNSRTDVSIDNSATYTDNSTNQTGVELSDVSGFMSRIADLLSVPRGNNIVSPASPAAGYGQNLAQSGQRTSAQTIASVGGFGLTSSGITLGSTSIPWKTIFIGSLVSLGLVIAYKKFFK